MMEPDIYLGYLLLRQFCYCAGRIFDFFILQYDITTWYICTQSRSYYLNSKSS